MIKNNEIKKKIENLPKSPGVYFFKDPQGRVIYIGKATSLRDRVRSYFNAGLEESRGPWISNMLTKAVDIDFKKTDSALMALLLESELIRKHKPLFNSREKDDKSFNYVVMTDEEFPVILTVRGRELSKNRKKIKALYVFGPFPQGNLLKEAIRIIRKIFPFRDEKCEVFGSRGKGANKPCFSRQIGLCPGTCTGEISSREYRKLVNHISLLFRGKKKELIKKLEKERNKLSKEHRFEKASELQRRIRALEHIRDMSLLNYEGFDDILWKDPERIMNEKDRSFRIEGYDVAHISGTFVVGAFSVIEGGEVKKSEYRKFRIKDKPGINDIGALREMVLRRVKHREWRFPDLIVVDGNEVHRNAALSVLSEVDLRIPVIAVSKDKNHRPHRYYGDKSLVLKHKKDIVSANMEAHRFALSYHRSLRERI